MKVSLTASFAAALLLTGAVALADELKSGPQKGTGTPAFNPLHATGKGKGGKACLV